ncbi:tudor domain-containing protein 7 [Eurytemora carolleeae]|uniref:tudor domain-containing protein 7 n=1 Tax=Eurytemora carolleeae TaxID=1294199 RepID=UPI000C772ED3|nr:tudor domain-containing protein 7 [Eurytemora carolleeae]|eukprot:XP_023342959.1 tudor domain-containing protein 7-like [Eurytemora affinis]
MSDLEETKLYITSVLLANGTNGVRLSSFCQDYENICQEPVPFKKFGFSNLETFLRSIPETCRLRMERGELVAHMVRTNETAYVVDMQEKTPIARKKKKGGKRNFSGSGYGGGYGGGFGGSFGGYSSSMNNPTPFKNPYSYRATLASSRTSSSNGSSTPTSSRPTPASMRPGSHKNIGSSTVYFSPSISANGLSKPTPKDSNQNRTEPKGNWEEYGRKVEKLLENRKYGSLSADVERTYKSEYNEVLPKDWVDVLDQRLIKVLNSYDHGNKHVQMLEPNARIYSESKPLSFTSDVQSTYEQVNSHHSLM